MRVLYGKITASHGLKGFVKILIFGQDASMLGGVTPLYSSETGDETLDITLKNPLGKYILAEVAGVTDRNGSDAIKGTEIWIDQTALPAIEDEDEFYVTDLIGMSAAKPCGAEIGKITAVDNYGAGDLLDIALPNGDSVMVPFSEQETSEPKDGAITVLTPEKWLD